MKFLPLFSVSLTHPYYADGRCLDFQIEPTLHTQQLLRNHRCVLKIRPDGVQVLTAVTTEKVPFIPLSSDMAWTFTLRLQNPEFTRFTDLTEITKFPAPLFTNTDLSRGVTHLALGSRQTRFAPGVFAEVEICHNATLGPIADGPSVFHVTFTAKQVRWIYYCVTELPQTTGELQIVDRETEAPLVFHRQEPDPADAVAAALAAQYPDRQRQQFVSQGLIACRQMARKHLYLSLNGEQMAGALPNPSLRYVSTLTMDRHGSGQHQEAWFHIVTSISNSR